MLRWKMRRGWLVIWIDINERKNMMIMMMRWERWERCSELETCKSMSTIWKYSKKISHFKSTKGKVMRNVLHVLDAKGNHLLFPSRCKHYCYFHHMLSLSLSLSFLSRPFCLVCLNFVSMFFGVSYVGFLFFFVRFLFYSFLSCRLLSSNAVLVCFTLKWI